MLILIAHDSTIRVETTLLPDRRLRLVQHLLAILWLALLTAYVLAGTPLAPFHGDEATVIATSRDYADHFLRQDYSALAYTPTPADPAMQELRLLNGTIARYTIGLGWHLAGFPSTAVNQQWDWGAGWEYNQTNGHAPAPDLLLVSRWPSALFLAGGVVLIFIIGAAVGGQPAAYLASLYLALNPALLLNGRRAMMEGSLVFFSLLVILAAIWLLQQPMLRRALLLGLAAGFALASKHPALFTVAAAFGAVLVYLVVQSVRSRDPSSIVEYLLLPFWFVAAAVMAGTFLALNPAWWGDPLARAQTVLDLREALLAGQTAAFGGYVDFSDQLAGFAQQVFVGLPQYYEVTGWDTFIADQIVRYEASPWRGVSLGGSPLGGGVFAVLILLGLLFFVRDLRGGDSRSAARWVVALWFAVSALSALFLTPLEWQRYYLPVLPSAGLLAACGVSGIIARLRHRGEIANR